MERKGECGVFPAVHVKRKLINSAKASCIVCVLLCPLTGET